MSTPLSPAVLEQLVELLCDALAPRIADELAARLAAPGSPPTNGLLTGLVTLDKLIAQLPASKRPETWRRWLYERLRRGEVPGAVKLAGSWFFRPEQVRAWLAEGCPPRPSCDGPELVP